MPHTGHSLWTDSATEATVARAPNFAFQFSEEIRGFVGEVMTKILVNVSMATLGNLQTLVLWH